MVLFTILFMVTLILGVITLLVVSIGGAVGIILFGDVIVCIGLLVFIMVKLIKKKR